MSGTMSGGNVWLIQQLTGLVLSKVVGPDTLTCSGANLGGEGGGGACIVVHCILLVIVAADHVCHIKLGPTRVFCWYGHVNDLIQPFSSRWFSPTKT